MKYEPLISDRFYHIYNQGNNGENIFFEEKNYYYFLKLLKKYIIPYSDIYCYTLMRNHFHLSIKTKIDIDNKTIQQSFSNLFNAYAKAINKMYHRNGSLFRDRYKRKSITDEKYLKQLIVYIHRNPQKHNFTNNFKEYKFSSYLSFLSNKDTNIVRKEVLNFFDDVENFIFIHNKKSSIYSIFD